MDYLRGKLYKSYIGSKMSLYETKYQNSVVKTNITGTSLVSDDKQFYETFILLIPL